MNRRVQVKKALFYFALFTIFLASCNPDPGQVSENPDNPNSTPTPSSATTDIPVDLQRAEVTFNVQIPAQTPKGKSIYLDILDEVTGLALNPMRFPMESLDDQHYTVNIPLSLGSVVKYRYAHEGNPVAFEKDSQGAEVRYRMLYIQNPVTVNDFVSAWQDSFYQGDLGRISGIVNDDSGNPLSDILVTAGGKQAITSMDGAFLIEGLPTGTHNLVAYSIDGSYLPYQQGALIAPNSTTPARIQMTPADQVNITFVVKTPEDTPPSAVIRMVGNIYSLGNTFADLSGGVSVVAARSPVLSRLPDGTYFINLNLPAEIDLSYKYTLGDGFWNAELKSDGSFRVRHLIVPSSEATIDDEITTWSSPNIPPVAYTVYTPPNTPANDTVAVQLNPYAWTEPLPMWLTAENQWTYVLYNPLHLVNNVQYRYCRNSLCNVAGTQIVNGSLPAFQYKTSQLPANITDVIGTWQWMDAAGAQVKIVGDEVISHGKEFVDGVEFLPSYDPSYQPLYPQTLQNVSDLGSNWVFITPTWHYTYQNPPVLAVTPGKDPLTSDLEKIMDEALQKGLQVAIYPHSITPDGAAWWDTAKRDPGWWQSWFDQYANFLNNYADLAEKKGAAALIIGEAGMLPGAAGGSLPDGTPSNVPPDADTRWSNIIEQIRSRFHGQLILALNYPQGTENPPGFTADFDQIYIQVSARLSEGSEYTDEELQQSVARIIVSDLGSFAEKFQKPVILGVKYPSTDQAVTGCLEIQDECHGFNILDQPSTYAAEFHLDLQEQFDIYRAFLSQVNTTDWIAGFVTRGYYPPAELQDTSSSIHGKPAAALLWYWYPRLRSTNNP
jgi:hypothetical protein